jgi:hypothetical protein
MRCACFFPVGLPEVPRMRSVGAVTYSAKRCERMFDSLSAYATDDTVTRVTELSCFFCEDNVPNTGFFPGTFLK